MEMTRQVLGYNNVTVPLTPEHFHAYVQQLILTKGQGPSDRPLSLFKILLTILVFLT
jgi:hypothetical protein